MSLQDAIASDGASHHWPLDESTPPFADIIGNLTVGPSFVANPSVETGTGSGTGVRVIGPPIGVNTVSWSTLSQWTLEFTAKYISHPNSYTDIFTQGNGNGVWINSGMLVWFGGSDNDFATIPTGQWLHCVFRYDNASGELFIDGISEATNSAPSQGSEHNQLFDITGRTASNFGKFTPNVILGDIAIYDKLLSDAKIADHSDQFFNSGFQVSGNVVDESDGSELEATIRAYRWDNGTFLGETTSDPSTGDYTLGGINYSGDWLVVMQPPSGLRPRSHGPITPVEA